MLRYKTETRPGLVALYDIRPGNGAGPFLEPWSPHDHKKYSSAFTRIFELYEFTRKRDMTRFSLSLNLTITPTVSL